MKTQNASYEIARLYVEDLVEHLPSEIWNSLHGYIRAKSLDQLGNASCLFPWHSQDQNMGFDLCYDPGMVLRALMQVEAFFKKNVVYSDDSRCAEAAIASFQKGELKCKISNKRLDYYYTKRERLAPDLSEWMSRMEHYIKNVLGPFDSFMDELPVHLKVTGGATSTRSRRDSQPFTKVSKRPVCQPYSAALYDATSKFFGYGDVRAHVRTTNRVELVLKNWKTHRTIAAENEGDIPFQLAFDSYGKRRLREVAGIDLRDQSRNQHLAYASSITGFHATVDVENASNTNPYNLPAWLFEADWFEYLNGIRARGYTSRHMSGGKYEMFSSMGNGSTFVVETLIFAAACYAVGSKDFSVYGDDIVIETDLVPNLTKLLAFCGFTLNAAKTHTHGLFRESCGVNCYSGVDITPFYVREWSTKKWTLSHNVNGLAKIALPGGNLWWKLRELVAQHQLPLVPINLSTVSGVFIDPHHCYGRNILRWKDSQTKFKAYVSTYKLARSDDSRSLFLWHLDKYHRRERAFTQNVRSKRPTGALRYRRKWVNYYPQDPSKVPCHLFQWSEYLLKDQRVWSRVFKYPEN